MTTLADTFIRSRLVVMQAAQDVYYNAQIGTDLRGNPTLRLLYQQLPRVVFAGGSYEIHEYNGPQGKGWILYIRVTVAGVVYQRQQDFGPEQRTYGWEVIS